jgi:serine/threonine-protein kinase RsbW
VRISFEVESDLKALDTVLEYFERLDRSGISREDWLQCQLALAEGFTNAVRHAHKQLPAHVPIEIEIDLTPARVELRIWDQGPPFDLEGFLARNPDPDSRWSGRGQGLPILRKISTSLSYHRAEDDRNCLSIVKSFSMTPSTS